jgi:hypothetical protein
MPEVEIYMTEEKIVSFEFGKNFETRKGNVTDSKRAKHAVAELRE